LCRERGFQVEVTNTGSSRPVFSLAAMCSVRISRSRGNMSTSYPRCKFALPWIVNADTGTFTAETTAPVPVVVDFWGGVVRAVSDDLARA
jgi:hypothetical protein